MKNMMRTAFIFLSGIVYSWAVRTAISPNFMKLSFPIAILSMLITVFGAVIIIAYIVLFFEEAWKKG